MKSDRPHTSTLACPFTVTVFSDPGIVVLVCVWCVWAYVRAWAEEGGDKKKANIWQYVRYFFHRYLSRINRNSRSYKTFIKRLNVPVRSFIRRTFHRHHLMIYCATGTILFNNSRASTCCSLSPFFNQDKLPMNESPGPVHKEGDNIYLGFSFPYFSIFYNVEFHQLACIFVIPIGPHSLKVSEYD